VARHITGGADIKVREDLGLSSGEVAVATGADFTTIHMQPTPVDEMPGATTTAAGGGAGGAKKTTTTTAPRTTTTTVPPTTTTTRSQYTIGDPPPGKHC
jgi:hypothetical protein